MKRITMAVLAAAGFTMAVASPAAAQGTTLGVGVGITNPMGNWKDKNVWGDKMGFHFGLGASFALGSAPVRARIEGTYTKASHDGFAGSTKLLGGMGRVSGCTTSRKAFPIRPRRKSASVAAAVSASP